jgi:hypothetical protein
MPHRLESAINYNENKVNQGKAECMYAANYLREVNTMNLYQKLRAFERLNELNDRAITKTLHISLNFDPSENLSKDKLLKIAIDYMSKIGFGGQPFLVYQHFDASHPHIHILTNTITKDGTRINTHNIGHNQSEKARKEIERKYGLVRAENQKQLVQQPIRTVNAEKLMYGKTDIKKSISNVVIAVLDSYKYTSLPEFNAILKQYNVVADRGSEQGRIFRSRGLVYRILDGEGTKVGVPIKASCINCKPTLDKLEKKFGLNKEAKEKFKQPLKAVIDAALLENPSGLKKLIQLLAEKNVYTLVRQNAEGKIYGITFVDNENKTVFNGSDLGKDYSAAHLQNKMALLEKNERQDATEQKATDGSNSIILVNVNAGEQQTNSEKNTELIDILFTPREQKEFISYQLLKKKRKRKKRPLRL